MKFITTLITLCLIAGGVWAKDVNWEHDYDAALEQAKKEKKVIMVDVYTDWCGWCKKLDKDVYSDKDVQTKLAKDFITVKVNPEKSAKNKKLNETFGARGYPHIVFIDADGKKVSEINGYVPAADFLKQLESVTKKATAK